MNCIICDKISEKKICFVCRNKKKDVKNVIFKKITFIKIKMGLYMENVWIVLIKR